MSVEVGWPLYLELEALKNRAAPPFGATTSEAVFLRQDVLFRSFLAVVQNCVLNRCMSFLS